MNYADDSLVDDFLGIDSQYPYALSGLGANQCPPYQNNYQGSCISKTCNGKQVLNYTSGKCQKQQSNWSASGCDDGSSVGFNGLCQNGTAPVEAHVLAVAAANPSPSCATGTAYDIGTQECWPINPATGQPMVGADATPQKLMASGPAPATGSSLFKKILVVGGVVIVAGAAFWWYKNHKKQAPMKGKRR